MKASVDDEDFERLSMFNWNAYRCSGRKYTESYYVRCYDPVRKKSISLHQEVLGEIPDGLEIDHIDGNGLNNTKDNLRLCTHEQNLKNRKGNSDPGKTSQFKGVYKDSRQSVRWRAQIRVSGKTLKLGDFGTELEAARKYDSAARHFYGEYALLNFPQERPEPYEESVKRLKKTSKYRGVCWDRETNKWEANIYFDSCKKKRLGRFADEKEAAVAYDKAALDFFGNKAKLNFPPTSHSP